MGDRATPIRRWIFRAVGVLVACALAYGIFCAGVILVGGRGSRLAPNAVAMAKQAQRTASAFEYIAIDPSGTHAADADGIGAISRALLAAVSPRVLGPGRSEKAPDAGPAVEEALRFVAALGTGSGAAYARWRESTGARFVGAFPVGGVRTVEWYREPYEMLIGDGFDPSLGPRAYFDAVFDALATQSGGALRPVEIATSPQSARVFLYLKRDIGDHIGYDPALDEGLGREFWDGGIGGAATRFWEYTPDLEQVHARDGRVWMCMVSIVARSRTGLAIPMQIHLFLDPRAKAWRVDSWLVNNVDRDAGVTDAVLVAPVF